MPIPDFVVELRKLVGATELWIPAITAVVRRGDELLLVKRADNGAWTPITGILDPGEEPAVGAAREALEETGVTVRVDRLAAVGAGNRNRVTHTNGDLAVYLDLTFACTWVEGEAHVADDESVDVRWWSLDSLPSMSPSMLERLDAALSGEERTRFQA
jgi:ADP-ribose pyrophosphatase YjhB (NUDIX family)